MGGSDIVREFSRGPRYTYRLVLDDDAAGCAHVIEFEGMGPEAVLSLAGQQCGSRAFRVYEDGRALGKLQRSLSGYWNISPLHSITTQVE